MLVLGLILLWFFPRWTVLVGLALALVIMNVVVDILIGRNEIVIDLLINIPLFVLFGGIIVEWHRRKRERMQSQEYDKEMQRIHAEIAARDGQPPAAS